MSELVVRFSGQFQLWGYTVSHGQLLLRRTRSELRPTQIDVLFKNVGYIQLPVLLEDPEVTLSEAAVKDSLGVPECVTRTLYQIAHRGGVGYVAAGACVWHEGDQDYDAQSPLVSRIGISITGGSQ